MITLKKELLLKEFCKQPVSYLVFKIDPFATIQIFQGMSQVNTARNIDDLNRPTLYVYASFLFRFRASQKDMLQD